MKVIEPIIVVLSLCALAVYFTSSKDFESRSEIPQEVIDQIDNMVGTILILNRRISALEARAGVRIREEEIVTVRSEL
jgi:hypothetical protein